jgi:hypothetical protein
MELRFAEPTIIFWATYRWTRINNAGMNKTPIFQFIKKANATQFVFTCVLFGYSYHISFKQLYSNIIKAPV